MPSVPVAELVRRAQRGDLESFSELVRRFQDLAFGFAYARRRDRPWALDIAQEAFLTAFSKLSELREPAAFPGWFRSILVKHIDRDVRRRAPPLLALDALERECAQADARGLANTDPHVELERAELRARLSDEVRALPAGLRTTVLLFYAGERSLTEVARFLQVPTGTVKRRLHDARARLKERMFDMVKEAIDELRPSRSPEFTERVRVLLKAVALGDEEQAAALLHKEPALAQAAAPHPIWGGEPYSLQVAAELGKPELVALLLDHGADPDVRPDAYNWSALHLALNRPRPSRAHQQTAELLIARGARVDLWAAAALGDVQRSRALLSEAPDSVHARGPGGATPLHFAAAPEVAQLLLGAGADPEAADAKGNTPARFAAYHPERRALTRFLLEQLGQEPDVFLASALGDLERVRALVAASPELLAAHTVPYDGVARLSRGATPLQVAVLNGQPEVVRTLLELGAEVDARSVDGQTALHLAAGNGELELVKLLVEHGADINAAEAQHGSTPLGWAEYHAKYLNGPASCNDVAEFLRGLA